MGPVYSGWRRISSQPVDLHENAAGDRAAGKFTLGREIRNQQYTAATRFKKDLSPTWNLELLQSYDLWAFKDQRAGADSWPPRRTRSADEQQAFSRAIAVWTPNDAHSLAFGLEYSHEWFHDPPYADALELAPVVSNRNWQTDTISLLAEHQWRITDQWTTFLSFRTDKHTYSDWLLSPRGTVVFTPTERDTFKVMAGQSVRRGGDEELWSQWERSRTIPAPETLRSYEISYERKLTDHWRVGGNAFFEDYDAIGWSSTLYHSLSIGKFQIAGGEFQLTYSNRKHAHHVVRGRGETRGCHFAQELAGRRPRNHRRALRVWARSGGVGAVHHEAGARA